MSPIGIIAALPGEAGCLCQDKLPVRTPYPLDGNLILYISGVGNQSAETATRALVEMGVGLLVSWGTAAALSPTLKPGDLVLAKQLIDIEQHRLSLDTGLRLKPTTILQSHGLNVFEGAIAETDKILSDKTMKADLMQTSGAIAADMESARIAKIGQDAGIPCLVLRAISDDYRMTIPSFISEHIDEMGRITPLELCKGILLSPANIYHLIRLGLGFRAAQQSLRKLAPLIRSIPNQQTA